jgi:hypothetical protein
MEFVLLDYKFALPKYSMSSTINLCGLSGFCLVHVMYEKDYKNGIGVNFGTMYDNFQAGLLHTYTWK